MSRQKPKANGADIVPLHPYLGRTPSEIQKELKRNRQNPIDVINGLMRLYEEERERYQRQVTALEETERSLQREVATLENRVVDLQRENAILDDRSRTDHLTQILNRRGYEERLGDELSRAQRHQYNINLLCLDVDHFKKVNDTYGHRAGDAVLQELVRRMRGCLRREDAVARFGGEEFAVIAPHIREEDAVLLAEKLRQQVAEHHFIVDGKPLAVTVSIGVASYHPSSREGIPGDELRSQADQALYAAKQGGRNRVERYSA